MLVIVGFVVVIVCVFGGFMLAGGHMAVLFQPIELLIIAGAGAGSVLIAGSPVLIKSMMHMLTGVLKDKDRTKAEYMELLMLLFDLCKQAKQNLLGLEAHVEKPHESEIFKKYPGVLKNHHAIEFIADTMKVQISSPVSPYDLEELMNLDLDSVHKEELKVTTLVAKVGDAMPGLGIVAAVLGVVLTMGKLSQGKEVIGHSVAAALVGTFIGILLSYGFIDPLARKMEAKIDSDGKYMDVIKQALLAFAKNCSPKVCVEFGRRCIPIEARPSFEDIDKAASGQKAA